ncbi:MAG: hypothetical protein M1823_003811 [Watsoniomyces obsoletus]|nr:MAG: hypothetical protein M1823_003811 [Watsoniomyces obsoletus]
MDITRWYGYSLIAVIGCLIVRQTCIFFFAFVRAYGLFYLLKQVFYPVLFKRRNRSDSITRSQAMIILIYLAANGLLLGLHIRTAAELQSRSSKLAMINMVPLFFGGRMNFWIDYLGITLQAYYLMHHWVGRVVVAQGLIHSGLAIAASMRWDHSQNQISGTIAATALLSIAIFSLVFIRRRFYETFIRFHFLLAATLAGALVVHIDRRNHRVVYLWIALGCWCLNFVLRTLRMIYRNLGGSGNEVQIDTFSDATEHITAVHIRVPVSRAWTFRAGQYVYLWFPCMGLRSWSHSHPYSVAWWDTPPSGDRTISFLVEPRNGLSRRLMRSHFTRLALMDGPYGVDAGLGDYETVLLFAGGIGIAATLSYVRHLVEGYGQRRIRTRRLSLVWILRKQSQ